MYIGHKREDGQVQPLRDHLHGVAARARSFAEEFGAGGHAYRTGLLHDVGKYAPDVQRRMADPEHVAKVNHTSAGAIAASGYRDLFAAFAIAGHHGGLPDLGARTSLPSDGTLQGKLKYRPQDYSAYQKEIHPDPGAVLPSWIGRDELAGSFYTRMLFSCLVDADFLDTEAFMQGTTSGVRAGKACAPCWTGWTHMLRRGSRRRTGSMKSAAKSCAAAGRWAPRPRACIR